MPGFISLAAAPSSFGAIDRFSPPLVADELFCALYPNRIQPILRSPDRKNWIAVSKHSPLTDRSILDAVSGKTRELWGARWGEYTRFAVLDIDPGSKYQNVQELKKLSGLLNNVGLQPAIYKSSARGGWHIYLFFDQWQGSKEVEQTLKAWLRAQLYEIRNGTLEVYPSGRGLRLPLQAGFAWLDAATGTVTTSREELSRSTAISRFLTDLDVLAGNWDQAKTLIDTQLRELEQLAQGDAQEREKRLEVAGFEGLFNYRLIAEKYEEGRRLWISGLTKKGQRHDAILAVEHYLWHGDQSAGVPALPGEPNDEARYRLILVWLQNKHNGFCNHINRDKWHKVETQIRRAVKWRRNYDARVPEPYPLTDRLIERLMDVSKSTKRTWSIEDFKKGNAGREIEAREKISQALEVLISEKRKVTIKQLLRLTKCSYHTIKRHSDIWYAYAPDAMPRVAGDKNSYLALELKGADGPIPPVPQEARDVFVVASTQLAPPGLVPPLLLPGCEPTNEFPVSRPSPSGSCGSLDTGFLIRRFSGRTSSVAGGRRIPFRQERGPPIF